ncbi:MAG: hypothetical protein MUF22_00955 [Chitinispirillaceae bacterium]|nr:hypothetical protein [Chitinispirillaceae bacterium]
MLSIDADEEITPACADAISGADFTAYAACSLIRVNYFMGRQLRFGSLRNSFFCRLFNRTCVKFEGMVHEHVVSTGRSRRGDITVSPKKIDSEKQGRVHRIFV